jgi:hypothetical protein
MPPSILLLFSACAAMPLRAPSPPEPPPTPRFYNYSGHLPYTNNAQLVAPVACSSGVDVIDVFARGYDKTLFTNHTGDDGRTWSGWTAVGPDIWFELLTDPTCAVQSAARLDIFAVGEDGHAWHKARVNGEWKAWARVP